MLISSAALSLKVHRKNTKIYNCYVKIQDNIIGISSWRSQNASKHQWAKQGKKRFRGLRASIPCSKYHSNPGFSKTQIIDSLGFVWTENRETGDEQREAMCSPRGWDLLSRQVSLAFSCHPSFAHLPACSALATDFFKQRREFVMSHFEN